jgi:hypothetical protein
LKSFNWSHEKNVWLKGNRGISFDEILFYLSEDEHLLDVIENPNYPNQAMFVVEIDDYVYLVPFVENDTEIFLKTIFPSRKANKHYLSH